jgi:hypothetical protein
MEDTPILPLLIAALVLVGFGCEVERRRARLRNVFDVFDREESLIAGSLVAMVKSGQLKPYVPGQPA